MKPANMTIAHHCRQDTMSSLESILTDSSSTIDDDDEDSVGDPFLYSRSSVGQQEEEPAAPKTPDPRTSSNIHILSCSSPEISNLCKRRQQQADDDSIGSMSFVSHSMPISPCGTMILESSSSPTDLQDLEGLSESLSKIEFFTPKRTALCSPDLPKPTRGHRRVSYDVLPSMQEIQAQDHAITPSKPSPLSSRHRRNTTQMMPSMW